MAKMAKTLGEMYYDFLFELEETNTNRIPKHIIIKRFDDAERLVNKLVPTILKTATFNSVNNTRTYSIDTNMPDLLYWHILNVWYSRTTSDKREWINPSSEKELDLKIMPWWRTTNGMPENWYLIERDRQLAFYPFEKTVNTGTDAIQVEYLAKHTKMTRLYLDGTISITINTKNVVGTDTAFLGNLESGDYIGVGSLSLGSNIPTYESVMNWYEIDTVNTDESITLVDYFTQASVSGVSYIGSQISSIENEELNNVTVLFAAAQQKYKDANYKKGTPEYEGAVALEQKAYDLLRQENLNEQKNAYNSKPSITPYNDGFM